MIHHTYRSGRFADRIGRSFGTVEDMARPIRHQVGEQILDRAAALFARHGFAHTSLKDLADAVGLSKAGLLHHYPSKEALFEAAREMGRAQGQQLFEQVVRVPAGPARDRRAVELITDFALERPGLVALASRAISSLGTDDGADDLDGTDALLFEMFAVDPVAGDTERLVRVIGMASALAVLCLAANAAGEKTAWRPHIITTCLDALGHRGPSAPPPVPA